MYKRQLIDQTRVEIYAGDLISRHDVMTGIKWNETINYRTALVKDVLVQLLGRLNIEITDIPPCKGLFRLSDAPVDEEISDD